MEDQRRRTLEALERRFAQAKSEVQSQKQNSKKRPAEDKKTVALHVESLSADSPINKPLSKSSSKRGKFSFTDHTSKEDTGLNEPAYLKLSHSVHENLLPNGAQVSDGRITVNGVLHELFQHGDSAKKYMQGSKNIKIENTILLDNYVHKHGSSSSIDVLWIVDTNFHHLIGDSTSPATQNHSPTAALAYSRQTCTSFERIQAAKHVFFMFRSRSFACCFPFAFDLYVVERVVVVRSVATLECLRNWELRMRV